MKLNGDVSGMDRYKADTEIENIVPGQKIDNGATFEIEITCSNRVCVHELSSIAFKPSVLLFVS